MNVKVRIKSIPYTNSNTYLKTLGKTGVIKKVMGNKRLAVEVDGIRNNSSQFGWFYYNKEHLEPIRDEEEEEMMLEPGYKIATVKYLDYDKEYNFALYDDLDGEFDEDRLLGITDSNKIVNIIRIISIENADGNTIMQHKQLKGVIDTAEYYERINKAEKRKKIQDEMDQCVAKLQKEQIYEMYAKQDPVLADLLKQFKEL